MLLQGVQQPTRLGIKTHQSGITPSAQQALRVIQSEKIGSGKVVCSIARAQSSLFELTR